MRVRTFFLGSIASPKIETRPLQVLDDFRDGELPEFEFLDEATNCSILSAMGID